LKRLYKLLLPLSIATVTTHAATKTVKYTVKSGDSLYTIAKKHHTTVDRLCKINHIQKSKILKSGHTIKIPSSVKRGKTDRHIAKKQHRQKKYIVKKGDTLSKVAVVHHTTVKALREANGLKKGTFLKLGQTLYLPTRAKKRNSIRTAKRKKSREERRLAKALIRAKSKKPHSAKHTKSNKYTLNDIVFGMSGVP